MRRGPSPLRRRLIWAALLASASIIVMWALSLRWTYGYQGTRLCVLVARGEVGISTFLWPYGTGFFWTRDRGSAAAWAGAFARDTGILPLWLLLCLAVAATGFLWWRNRAPVGHCGKCGYDLTGNVSGRCPECGDASFQEGH